MITKPVIQVNEQQFLLYETALTLLARIKAEKIGHTRASQI